MVVVVVLKRKVMTSKKRQDSKQSFNQAPRREKKQEQMVSFGARKHSKIDAKTSTPHFLATPRKTRKTGYIAAQKKNDKMVLFVINGEVVQSGPGIRKWNLR
jgi:hypothetical protein